MKQENKDQQAMSFADKYEEGYKAGVYDTKRKQWKPSEEQMEALDKKGWTQFKLAQMIGMPSPVLNDYISGKRLGINPRQVIRIALPLGLDPHELATSFVNHSIDIEMEKLLNTFKVWTASDNDKDEN